MWIARKDVTNLEDGNRFANAPNTPVGYELKFVVLKPSETDATLAYVHFHGHEEAYNEAAVQCHGHFCMTSRDRMC
jgi:hypothetical protein